MHSGKRAATILEFLQGLRGCLSVTFEEGTSTAWLHDLLKPHVSRLVVCQESLEIATHLPFDEHILRRDFLLLDCTAITQSHTNQFGRLRGVVETISATISQAIRLSIGSETCTQFVVADLSIVDLVDRPHAAGRFVICLGI
jgi:hypothetical protein